MLDGSACPSMADDFLHSSEPPPCADGGLIHCNIIGAYRKAANAAGGFISVIAIRCALFAVFARREVAAVDGLLEEGFLAVGPKLADVRIGLDDRIPELVLVVPEHLRLLDFL